VRGVDDYDAFAQLIREQPRALAQHRGLADAGPAEQKDALAADDDVADDLAGAGDRAADTHRETCDATRPVANRRDAVQRPLDARPVVVAELAHVVGDVLEVGCGHRAVREKDLATGHARLGLAAEVENDLEQLARVGALVQRPSQVGRQRAGEELDLLVPPPARAAAGHRKLSGFRARRFRAHPKEGTSPFSWTGTCSASSLTRRSCVRRTLNPRPRRASIICES